MKVTQRIAQEMHLMRTLQTLTPSSDQILRSTSVPETLNHMELYNRGGLTHVTDKVFMFFVRLEMTCQKYFKVEMVRKYKGEAFSAARKLVRDSPDVKVAWQEMWEEGWQASWHYQLICH